MVFDPPNFIVFILDDRPPIFRLQFHNRPDKRETLDLRLEKIRERSKATNNHRNHKELNNVMRIGGRSVL